MAQKNTQQVVTQTIAYTVFTWFDHMPLEFEAVTQYAVGEPAYSHKFNLVQLTAGFKESFLLGLKELFMQRHIKGKARTVNNDFRLTVQLLKRIQSDQTSADLSRRLMVTEKIVAIDSGLMVAIRVKLAEDSRWIPMPCMATLNTLFRYAGNGKVFTGLEQGDFPSTAVTAQADLRRQKIVSQALSRTLQIAVLTDVERRFQAGDIHLGVYVLWNVTNALYARPESLRQIRCGDLRYTENKVTGQIEYTLWVMPAKRQSVNVRRMPYSLTPVLGHMLVKQKAWVIENIGAHYGLEKDLDPEQRKAIEQRLSLFPRINGGERKEFEIKHFGMLINGADFANNYLWPIQCGLDHIQVNFVVMRHTIGTQLAAAGVSASVIQAVLRHATDNTARVYIDLAAKELRESLNNGLEALADLFPAYNSFMSAEQARVMARDAPERVVKSYDPIQSAADKVDVQISGACGNSAACAFAPLSCYGCWRWIANVDADHSVNLRIVQDRIKENEVYGKSMRSIVERDRLLEKVILLRMGQFEKHKAEHG